MPMSIANPTFRAMAVATSKSVTINRRLYSGAGGTVIDIPFQDRNALGASGWIIIAQSGITANRPTGTGVAGGFNTRDVGTQYLDTTLGYVIYFDGLVWRNPSTGAAV